MCRKIALVAAVLYAFDTTARAQWTANRFEFYVRGYYASPGATNALIGVAGYRGNPNANLYVDYATAPGTAVPGQDYEPVQGMLSFGYSGYATFSVPLIPNPTNQELKTIHLSLSPSQYGGAATISGGYAELFINYVAPPTPKIAVTSSNAVILSWIEDGTHPVLEKSTSVTEPYWVPLQANYASINGTNMAVIDPVTNAAAFYRLVLVRP